MGVSPAIVKRLPLRQMAITIKGKNFYKNGRRIRLAGNHTWNNVQRIAGQRIGIDKITGNFTRAWTIETGGAIFSQSQWGSNTPGLVKVQDGPWKKDGSLNNRFYTNLENFVKKAEERDIVVGVSLFENSIERIFPQAWENHPFNGLGPPTYDKVHTKGPWNKFQREHVKEVVNTLEQYDNVFYEVGNELPSASVKWFQPKVVKWVKKWSDKPVGVSYASGIRASRGRDELAWMKRAGADWYGPTFTALQRGQFNRAGKPIVFDTDHSWPLLSNPAGLKDVWSKGHNVWVMDGFNGTMLRNQNGLGPDLNLINEWV
jgi:hypothetical protein